MKSKKIISLLLALVLIFSVFPTSVFAGPGGGGGGGDAYEPTARTDGSWWAPDAKNYQFMRFSLYFAETDASTLEEIRQLEAEDKLVYRQLGKTINVRVKGTKPSYSNSKLTVHLYIFSLSLQAKVFYTP